MRVKKLIDECVRFPQGHVMEDRLGDFAISRYMSVRMSLDFRIISSASPCASKVSLCITYSTISLGVEELIWYYVSCC